MLCASPIFLEQAGGTVGCGQCLFCGMNKRRQKTTQIVAHGLEEEHALFVTLTYEDKFLPREIFDFQTGEVLFSHPDGCLDRRALQLFLKRLRRRCAPGQLSYYYCGEYGRKNTRPHFHILLFGLPFKERYKINESWCDPFTGELMCDPDRLDVQQPKSQWDVAQYCSSYVVKRLTKRDPRLAGRPPEFGRGSNGLGAVLVDDIMSVLSQKSGMMFLKRMKDVPRTVFIDGKQLPVPPSIRKKVLERINGEEISAFSQERFQEEMRALSRRAKKNKAIPSIWFADSVKRQWALEKQQTFEQAQKVKNAEARASLFEKEKVKC